MPGNAAADTFLLKNITCLRVGLHVAATCEAEGAGECRYGYKGGLVWVHVRADMGSCERVVMGLESRAVSARVIKHFVTILVKHVIIQHLKISSPQPIGSIEPHRGQDERKLAWRLHGNIDIEKS